MNLFNAGIKPAINVGISVSRIGGAAQIKAIKKVAATLKLDQAQFADLEAFSKFSADLDATTKKAIDRGRKNQELLKQNLHTPMPIEEQVAILYIAMNGYLDSVPLDQLKPFEKEFLALLRSQYATMFTTIAAGKWETEMTEVLVSAAAPLVTKYSPKNKERGNSSRFQD